MAKSGSNKKVANSLVAVSAAAVLAVYAAGYTRTRSAANQIEARAAERRPVAPDSSRTTAPSSEFRATAPNVSERSPATPASSNPARDAARKTSASTESVSIAANLPSSGSSTSPTPETPAAPVVNPVAEPAAPVAEQKAGVAAATVAALPVAPATDAQKPAFPPWKDGKYYGWGTCRHGNIQAAVVIEGGRIASAIIAQCLTRYDCSMLSHLPGQVTKRQSPEVDYVSGATQSTDAFYWAVWDALRQAK